MKRIGFVFTQSPHGSSAGREGLDALLAMSALTEDIVVFFVSDGVFQLLPQQAPEKVLARDYISTFGILNLYDIDKCFICSKSLSARGLSSCTEWVLDVTPLEAKELRKKLSECDSILTF